ncbi:Integrin alpha-IIb [Anabarilius grahami]|uniref:Integrin alpha-IIb n=1 Tax=Anabarilius grahami TaxID=495550 RepID=A0A3N0Y2W6_ANAGA|nr:Integrin alpha-IIb [Anabarilius grahami]
MEKRLEVSLLFFTGYLSIFIYPNHISGFNLDLNKYTVFSGPEDSYFGFSVDFYQSSSKSISVVVGAPRANTSQPGISHGGSVFICPWTSSGESCQTLNFDQKGDENITFGNMLLMAHKSNQWLGASVRAYNNYILCVIHVSYEVGLCPYVPLERAFGKRGGHEYTCWELPAFEHANRTVGKLRPLQGRICRDDLHQRLWDDILIGAPLFLEQLSTQKFREVGQVYVYLQRKGFFFSSKPNQMLTGTYAYGRFGSAIAPLGDIDHDGFNDVAVGAPGSGEGGQVFIYLGQSDGLTTQYVQVIESPFHTLKDPPMFGFSMRGGTDIDDNGYPVLNTELQLDRMKQSMARRTLLLESNQPYTYFQLRMERNSGDVCRNFTAYLLPEFKDKLSPIFFSVNYSLADSQDAVLHGQSVAVGQTRIILNCGPDNICIPDLKLKAVASTEPILIGDENPALLIIEAENQGEGAYETELYISPPAHTHYQGVVSNRQDFSHLVCGQKKENGSVIVVCDLGNPMEGGHQLRNMGPSPVNAKLTLEFPVSQNESYLLYVFANASQELISCQTDYSNIDPRGLVKLESSNVTIGQVHHFNKRDLSQKTEYEQQWQHTVHVNCSSGDQCLLFECEAAGLQRDERAIVRVMSRLWVQTFLKRPYVNYVLHSTAHYEVKDVPSKIQPVVLPRGKAQVGFFKRNRPPCDDDGDDTQQLSGDQNE